VISGISSEVETLHGSEIAENQKNWTAILIQSKSNEVQREDLTNICSMRRRRPADIWPILRVAALESIEISKYSCQKPPGSEQNRLHIVL
jgi:hypothetical protein